MAKNIIFGLWPVIEAVRAGTEIEKVFLKTNLRGESFHSLLRLLKQENLPFQYVPAEKLNRLTGKNHQGVIALISTIPYQKIADIIPSVYEKGETPLILVVDKITDVRNFGAIARTAECAGVHAILTPSKGGAMIGPDAIRTSAGALNSIPVCRSEDLAATLRFMKDSGLKIVAASEKEGVVYYNADLKDPAALVMGSEELGISPALMGLADIKISIPVHGKTGSLNVSAAASVLLYEFTRQRGY